MSIHKLEIKLFEFCHRKKDGTGMEYHRHADFLVDGEILSNILGLSRDNTLSGSTLLDVIPPPKEVMSQFLGDPSEIAADKKRVTLYQICSDDGDVRGVVSCEVKRTKDIICWSDIRSQGLVKQYVHEDLTFDYDDYYAELMDYIERNPTTA